jgi:DNA-binding transcriptional LysR family regulator
MPLRFTLRQLEYLVAVGDCGSVAAAAQRVGVSSPSISVAIAQLEAELGLSLFVRRHAQGLSLTQAGRQVLDQARFILAEAGRMTDIASTISGTVRGTLRLGCLLTFAQIVLPQLRRSFVNHHPQVDVRQMEGDQDELIEALRRAEIDLALTYDLALPSDCSFEPLVSLPAHVLLAPDHPLAGRATLAPEDLADHPMVLLDLPHSADYFLSAFAARGLRPQVAERTRDIAVMRGLVAAGFGYSIANIRPLSDSAADGQPLRFVPLSGALRPLRMGLLMVEGAGQVQTIRAFAAHCRAHVTDRLMPGLQTVPPSATS